VKKKVAGRSHGQRRGKFVNEKNAPHWEKKPRPAGKKKRKKPGIQTTVWVMQKKGIR